MRAYFLVLASLWVACGQEVTQVEDTAIEIDPGQEVLDDEQRLPEMVTVDDVLRASCDHPLSVPFALPETVAESAPNYDAELAALDLDSMPAAIDLSITSHIERGVIAYMLDVDTKELDRPLSRSVFDRRGLLGKAALAAVKRERDRGQPGVDFTFLRRGLHRYYACSSRWPMSLEDFKRVEGDFTAGTRSDLEVSRPKNGQRRIYELTEKNIFAAETIVDGQVRETEILVAGRRAAGTIDFIVYDSNGALTDRSTFATSAGGHRTAAAPYSCMTCHYNTSSGQFDVVFPH